MASFDPSVISQIPDYAGNPLEARGKAYKLADLMTQEQSNRILLEDQKKQQADQDKARAIYQKFGDKVGTAEGNVALAGELAKSGLVKQSREAYQFGSEQQVRDLQQKKYQLEILQAYKDQVAPAAARVQGILQTQGLAMAQAEYARVLPTIPQDIRKDWPQQLPNDLQQANALIQRAIDASPKVSEMILKLRSEATKEASEKEKETHDRATEAATARREERAAATAARTASGKPPAGFEWDPDKEDTLRPIAGGPKDPNSKPWTGREKVFGERIITSANEAASAIKNITELPVGASTGFMGVGKSPGDSIFHATRDVLRNAVSSQEVQSYGTMLAGVRRNLAAIESAGLVPSGALTESMASVELRQGDTQSTKLRKLAEMRQIVDAGLDVQLADPSIPDSIKDVARKALNKIHDAVPFTQSDVTKLENSPGLTLQKLIDEKGLRSGQISKAPGPYSDPEKEKRYQEYLKAHPNG